MQHESNDLAKEARARGGSDVSVNSTHQLEETPVRPTTELLERLAIWRSCSLYKFSPSCSSNNMDSNIYLYYKS